MFPDSEVTPRREVGSLDRFVHTRGLELAGSVLRGRMARATHGSWMLHAALVVVLINALRHGPGVSVPRGILLGLAILISIQVVTWIRTALMERALPASTGDGKLTPEAMRLLQRLVEHLEGWSFTRRHERKKIRRAIRLPSTHGRRCEDVLSPNAFAVLESAAWEYNRVRAALATPDESPTLRRLAPGIRAAAEEAIAEVLHAASLLEQFPESGAPAQAAAARTAELRSLADELDRIRTTTPSLTLLSGASRIQGVLDELRADRLAREELRDEQPLRSRRE
jgi:hypothetical protein